MLRISDRRTEQAGGNGFNNAHPVVILLAGPFIGLAYAILFPFIGIAAIMRGTFSKVLGTALSGAGQVAHFGWRPSEAYLLGKKTRRSEKS